MKPRKNPLLRVAAAATEAAVVRLTETADVQDPQRDDDQTAPVGEVVSGTWTNYGVYGIAVYGTDVYGP